MAFKKMLSTCATLALLAATAASAGNVHLQPPNSKPSFVDGGLVLSASGKIAGLGNGDLIVTLTANANTTANCTNPSGQTQPPGQNPAPTSVSGGVAIPDGQIKNGAVNFSVTTSPPTTPVPGAPDCPSAKWSENIQDLSFTSAFLTVQQPAGTVVLTRSCAISPATSNGNVPAFTVTC